MRSGEQARLHTRNPGATVQVPAVVSTATPSAPHKLQGQLMSQSSTCPETSQVQGECLLTRAQPTLTCASSTGRKRLAGPAVWVSVSAVPGSGPIEAPHAPTHSFHHGQHFCRRHPERREVTDIGSLHSTRRGVGACGTESATVTTEVMCQVGWEAWCPVNPQEAVTFQKHFLHLNRQRDTTSKIPYIANTPTQELLTGSQCKRNI